MSIIDEATKTQLRNIETQTGKSLDELIQSGLSTGISKHKELQAFFTNEYGLTYGNANTLAILTRDKTKGAAGGRGEFRRCPIRRQEGRAAADLRRARRRCGRLRRRCGDRAQAYLRQPATQEAVQSDSAVDGRAR